MKVLMPILKLVVYPGLAVMAQKFIEHWGDFTSFVHSLPHMHNIPPYIFYGFFLLIENPLKSWIKDQPLQ